MKKLYALLLMVVAVSSMAVAQTVTVRGKVLDKSTNEAVIAATVKLLKTDSTYVSGVTTGTDGSFALKPVKAGKYMLRITYVGYKTMTRYIQLASSKPSYTTGTILLESDAIMLKGAEITSHVAKVEVKADTFVYNAAAYRVPEGSVLEELVKQLPGAEVSSTGTIKINGKEVKQIMMNGKEFFGTDTKIAMKNIPTTMVDKIKAYDKKSDYAKVTGIDDGEESTVLDLSVKKGMNQGWFGNTDLGIGTKSRYTGKVMVNRFTDNSQMSLIGSSNNVNDMGFGGGGGGFRGGGGGGLTDSKMAGFNFAMNNGKKETENGRFELGGNVRFNHTGTDSESRTNSQTFLSSGTASSYSNSNSHSYSHSNSFNSDFRMEWAPDTMTNIIFRPSFSYSESNNSSKSSSVTFNADPYNNSFLNLTNPLDEYKKLISDSLVVNSNERMSKGDSRSRSVNGELQINRKLNTKGRNVTLRASGGYDNNDSHSYSISDINYYLQTNNGKSRNTYTNQYIISPSTSYNYSAQLSYSEPIFKGGYLQGSYRFSYRYSDSDREMYSLDSIYTKMGYDDAYKYPLGYIPAGDTLSLYNTLNKVNSQYATYKYYNHDFSIMFRYVSTKYFLSAGVSFQPQYTRMSYQKNTLDTVLKRNVFNVSPRLRFRYKFSQVSQLNIRYSGSANQPSMTNLLDVTDTSDPLNRSMGNPGLKPSWTNNFDMFYNGYITDKQRGWMVHAGMNQTSNSISNAVFYNEKTGARASIPMNINGNWDMNSNVMFNTALDEQKYFNLTSFAGASFSRAVGYISTNADFESINYRTLAALNPDKSVTKTTNLSERLNGSYRNDYVEVGLNGSINYQHARNDLQSNYDLDTYTFSYGGNLSVNTDIGIRLATDLSENSRRGYNDASMNTNELIWNAQLSYSFLKGNAATVSVQWYDILHNQSSISRMLSATQRTDTWTNSIHDYLMVHFIYRLNLFGNSAARQQMRNGFGGRDFNRGGGFGGGFSGGRGGGGFGGGGGRGPSDS
jgi:uncharacterized membrane protein YgcG